VETQIARANEARDINLVPFYKEHSRDGNVVLLDGDSPIAKIFQRRFQVDTLINRIRTGGVLAIQEKIRFNDRGYDDILIEEKSYTIPHDVPGWLHKIDPCVEIVLYASIHGDGQGATCFPLPWPATRDWILKHKNEFHIQKAPNPINGVYRWSHNLIVPRRRITQALKFEGFTLREGKVVGDFWGIPHMEWIE
jgi:hypothetical protein